MENILMNNYFQGFLVLVLVSLITVFAKLVLPKIKAYLASKGVEISDDEVKTIFDTIAYITDRFGFIPSDKIVSISFIVYDALDFVNSIENITDVEILTELVLEKSKETLLDQGVEISEKDIEIVEMVIKFAITQMKK